MATFFGDSKGIILIDYKPAGTSITGEYYVNVIKKIRVAINGKPKGKASCWCPSFAWYAPVHKSRLQKWAAICECKFQ